MLPQVYRYTSFYFVAVFVHLLKKYLVRDMRVFPVEGPEPLYKGGAVFYLSLFIASDSSKEP